MNSTRPTALLLALVGITFACAGCNTGSRESLATTSGASTARGASAPLTSAANASSAPSAPSSGTAGAAPSVGAPSYPGAGSGTTYYVDGSSGDDSNPGTQASPWRTVDRIEIQTFAPGDLVQIKAGTYDLDTNLRLEGIRGSATAWIGLQADGVVVIRNAGAQNVVSVRDCAYLFLKGLEITHDNGGAPYSNWTGVDGVKFEQLDSNDIALDTCSIHDIGNVGISSQTGEIRGLIVYGCEIADCYTGIYLGYYEDANKRYAHFSRIANNYIHDCPPQDLDGTGYGIQIKGGSRGNVIEDNVLVDVAGNSRAGIAVYHASTDRAVASEQNLIRRNFVHRSRGEGVYAAEGAVIENNLIYESNSSGIVLNRRDSGSWGVFYGNLQVRNNTVYLVGSASARGLYVGDSSFTGPFVISSNVLVVTGAGQLALRGPGAFAGTATLNRVLGGTSGGGLGAVNLPGLTVFESTTFGDLGFLRPLAGGDLIDAGDPAWVASDDFRSTARGTRPDAGAFEVPVAGPGLADAFKP
ncbi:MAG: right-handed parallel beta-helix repeat-containing protein [Planctomycetes bacterium]|nr:right-handed parallel beta-helix repeat-containing protein [Planctomycetota bacterium]